MKVLIDLFIKFLKNEWYYYFFFGVMEWGYRIIKIFYTNGCFLFTFIVCL